MKKKNVITQKTIFPAIGIEEMTITQWLISHHYHFRNPSDFKNKNSKDTQEETNMAYINSLINKAGNPQIRFVRGKFDHLFIFPNKGKSVLTNKNLRLELTRQLVKTVEGVYQIQDKDSNLKKFVFSNLRNFTHANAETNWGFHYWGS